MKYRCIKGFLLDVYDGDGFHVDETFDVEEGTVWEETEENLLGSDVHLENETHWIEIAKEHLEEYFAEVEE